MSTARLSPMMDLLKFPKTEDVEDAPASFFRRSALGSLGPTGDAASPRRARADRIAVWILLAIGLLLMLVSVGKGEQPTATRTDRFNGTLASGQTIHVENVSGDVIASPGAQFSAVVTVTAWAATAEKATELLKKTEISTEHDNDGWSLETVLPGSHGRRNNNNRNGLPCQQCKVVARYEIVIPAGVTAELSTVNGDVRVKDVDGELNLESVNGSIEVRGSRRALSLQTVNGHIDAVAQALPAGADASLQSVNGNVTLTLPKDARFDFAASTMNGMIVSTFPLPPSPHTRKVWMEGSGSGHGEGKTGSKTPNADKSKEKDKWVVEDEDGNTQEVDLNELDQQLADNMKQVEISIEKGMKANEEAMRQVQEKMQRIEIPGPNREYSGSIGKGGPDLHMETLNGRIVLLAAGTKESDAKALVPERSTYVVTVPQVHVHVPDVNVRVRVPPVPPAPPAPRAPRAVPPPPGGWDSEGGDVVRGDVAGDFLSTSSGDYRVGKVSGKVQILTHSGEIRVGGAGAGADLQTYGGDIVVGPVTGDLKASTRAGDIVGQTVSGSVLADTNGGDVRFEKVGGNFDVRTSGGDIRVPRVGGAVRAASAGGEIRIGLAACDPKASVTIRNDGGDVALALPTECKADVELVVTGDEDESAIHSDFDLVTTKRAGTQRATATLNGGGEKIVVRTTSGTIRLRKGAGS
jgi:DUF4097 and DUF4098 domain-containing protein YvlB